jgi:hypothetical protein
LDAALKVGLAHDRRISKGRKAEDRPIPDKDQLQEMTTASYHALSAIATVLVPDYGVCIFIPLQQQKAIEKACCGFDRAVS